MFVRSLKTGHAAAAALALSLIAAAPATGADYTNPELLVSAETLATQMDMSGVVVVDVRPRDAYDAGHVPGAVHLGADDLIAPGAMVDGDLKPVDDLVAMLRERGIAADSRVVLYDDRGGFHASRLFWLLEYFGHRNAAILDGGFPAWERAGLATDTEMPDPAMSDFTPSIAPRRLATADWLLDRQTDAEMVVIDVRPADVYAAGHIPWAQNIPWTQNLNEDGTMRPADELLAHFAGHGVTPQSNVAVHCQNGKAAAHSYFTLRLLGFPQVRSYDRSWAEWGNAGDLPVTTAEQL